MVMWVCINSRHPNIGRPLVGITNAGDSAVVPKSEAIRWDFQDLNIEAFQSLGLKESFLDGEIHQKLGRSTHTHTCFFKKAKVFVGCRKKKTC